MVPYRFELGLVLKEGTKGVQDGRLLAALFPYAVGFIQSRPTGP